MRIYLPFFIALGLVFCACGARAQVTVDLNALNALPGPAVHPRTLSPPPTHYARRYARPLPIPPEPPGENPAVVQSVPAPGSAPVVAAQKPPTAVAVQKPPAATLPAQPPPPAAIASVPSQAPAVPSVPAGPPALAPAQIAPAAPTPAPPAQPLEGSVTFAAGDSNLSKQGAQTLAELGRAAAASPDATVNVLAYAPADPHDPSTARRISLERALAIRTALMSAGVPSSRIYVRALGSEAGAGSPDRATITVLGANLPATAQADTKGKQQQ